MSTICGSEALNRFMILFVIFLLSPFFCAESLQSSETEYPRSNPEGRSSGGESRARDGASVSDWCGRPATSRRQAHAGAA